MIPVHQDVGVGLRAPHIDYFLHQSTQLSWLEIHSENYFLPRSHAREQLRKIRQHYDISCHGIGLSLGSATPVNRNHLQQLKILVDEIEPILVSDHLSWSEQGGHYFNDLLPLPYTEEALELFCRNVDIVQDYLKRPLLIENPSSYLRFSHSSMPEWEFLTEVQARTDCRLLLDLNNIYVSAFNHGFDCGQYLNGIDPLTVDEIHLAGFTIKQYPKGEIWIDTHNQPICDEVWLLFTDWVTQHGSRKTLIEWDIDLPKPRVLLEEASKASHIITEPHLLQRGIS